MATMQKNPTVLLREPKPHRQQRAQVTRQQLIAAARTIFARDGFEQARIEDIAVLANKTRGAFYDNFASKEEVFFAIFEEDIREDERTIRPLLQSYASIEERLDALASHLTTLCQNRERMLLHLAFKAYAIRHPSQHKRLAAMHGLMRASISFPEIEDFLPEVTRMGEPARRACSLELCGTVEGIALNQFFDQSDFDAEKVRHYLRACLQAALFPEKAANQSAKSLSSPQSC